MRISKMRIDQSTRPVASSYCQVPGAGYRRWGKGRSSVFVTLLSFGLLCFSSLHGQEARGQDLQSPDQSHAQGCPDPPPQTSGSHIFRRLGETFDIPISVADCQPVSLVLHWSNGRNNGGLLNVTFLDSNNHPIYSRGVSVFRHGLLEMPFASLGPQPWFAAPTIVAVPTTVVIQTVRPFASPAGISFTVSRKAARVRSKPRAEVQPVVQQATSKAQPLSVSLPILDDQVATKLRTAEGRVLSQGDGSWASNGASVKYKLKELRLPEPREIEIRGRRETVEFAYRLTVSGAESSRGSQRVGTSQVPALSKFGLIWLDDAALPAFSLDSQEISTLIYDRSVLREGAQISVSNSDGSEMHSLVEPLKYQSNAQSPAFNVKTNYESSAKPATSGVQSSSEREEGNEVVSIRSVVRAIGATRIPLVQIELRTNRPFPPRDSPLQLQIGKRFFLNELTGDYTGRSLTLTVTQEMFAELNEGATIVAFFDKPDRSGFAGRNVWHFGSLDKSSLR